MPSIFSHLLSPGKIAQEDERAPAGATEIIDHGKRFCRPPTRLKGQHFPHSHGCEGVKM
jgi:hypothetical protein